MRNYIIIIAMALVIDWTHRRKLQSRHTNRLLVNYDRDDDDWRRRQRPCKNMPAICVMQTTTTDTYKKKLVRGQKMSPMTETNAEHKIAESCLDEKKIKVPPEWNYASFAFGFIACLLVVSYFNASLSWLTAGKYPLCPTPTTNTQQAKVWVLVTSMMEQFATRRMWNWCAWPFRPKSKTGFGYF